MILKYFLVISCIFIVEITAGTIDCKTIDNQKFKELFNFKYSGGSLGLKFDFVENVNSNKFKVDGCSFEITILKSATYGSKTQKIQANKNKLGGLQPCTKYDVTLTIRNLASKKSFSYSNFVTTKPDKDTKVLLFDPNIEEEYVDLSWSSDAASESGCITNITAVLKNKANDTVAMKPIDINSKMFTFEDLKPSKTYVAQLIASDDKGSRVLSNELKIKMKSSETDNEIEDIDVTLKLVNVKTNDAQLMWDLSDEIDSTVEYKFVVIDARENVIFSDKFTNNSVVIRNLEACSEYKAKVSIFNTNKSSELTFETKYAAPGDVKDIKYHVEGTKSIFSWNPPDLNANCVSNYSIIHQKTKDKNTTSPQWTVAKNETSKVINRLPYSKRIYIHVYANHDTSDNATRNSKIVEFENFNIDEFVVSTIRESRLSPTEVQLQWSHDTSYSMSGILDHFDVFIDDKFHNSTEKPLINLKIEACKKNYTITVRCASKGGNVGPNVTYHTNLNDKDVQLSAINTTDINVNQNSDSVSIAWKPNMNEASCIAYYEIKFAEEVFKTNEPKMEINKFESCMLYQMSIVPVSESGTNGEITNYEYVTNVLAPEKPSKPSLINAGNRELTISSSISDNDKRCVDMTPTFIVLECNNIKVEEKIDRSQSHYTIKITNLQPNVKYLCTARVKNSNGTSEKSEVAEFKTLQDSPQPPNEIRSTVSDNLINVKWKANNSTGFADYYQVHVKFVKFLYNFGKNCDVQLKNNSVYEAVDTSINITNLMPFSQYKLKVLASNKYGKSNFSEEIIINTSPANPTEPRNVTVQFKAKNMSVTSAFLSWKAPCMMNGKFSLYTITVNGHRKGVKSDKRTEASSTEEIELRDLSPGFKYDIEIQAVNQQHGSTKVSGKVVKFTFTSPSGIPEGEDLKEWTLLGMHPDKHDPGKIEVFLKRRMLISKAGDITGIAFLIFLANCPDLPQSTFGYLSSTNVSLPSAQQNLNCSQLYQQTKILPNPLTYDDEIESGNLDMYTTKFVIGEEDCSSIFKTDQICNGPLKCENCTYGLMARVFTSNGFRDTEPVIFETKSPTAEEFLEIPSIIYVAGSLLLILILSIIVCIFCCLSIRRNRRRIKKKKEAAETVENLLSFTSYCVIDKNPTPRHQFDHLL